MVEYIERGAAIANRREYNLGGSYDNTELAVPVSAINSIPAAKVRPVVLCKDCKWWTKQEASLRGRCELLQMYPHGTWFCANGNPNGKEED